MQEQDLRDHAVLCADGPMAGSEFSLVALDGEPPSIIDVSGVPYVLGVQSRPVSGRSWRYHVFRPASDDEDLLA